MDHHDQEPTWQGSRPDDGNMFPATPGQSWGGESQTPPGQPPYPPQQPYPLYYPGGYQSPGAAPPGGQHPGAPYPGPGYPGWGPSGGGPPPSEGRGLQWWHWLLIAVGGALVLCCACSFVGYAVIRSPSFTAGYATAEATRYPQATATPTTSFVGVSGRMQLGISVVWNGSGYTIVYPRDHFAASDSFAAVVDLGTRSFTATSVKLLLVSVGFSGTEKVVDSTDRTVNPLAQVLVIRYPTTSELMSNHPPGMYKFEVSVNGTVVAQAKFTYTG